MEGHRHSTGFLQARGPGHLEYSLALQRTGNQKRGCLSKEQGTAVVTRSADPSPPMESQGQASRLPVGKGKASMKSSVEKLGSAGSEQDAGWAKIPW